MKKYVLVLIVSSLLSLSTANAGTDTCPAACTANGIECSTAGAAQITTILEAVCKADSGRLRELIADGQDVKSCDRFGLSYLHMAAGIGNSEIIEILLDAGAPIDRQCGRKKSTPAHSAVRFDQLTSLQTFVQHNADLTLVDSEGKTPKQLAEDSGSQEILDYLASLEK